ncbi:MAG: sigma factor-like helix-turn-helix DNA-binding protein [Planctomycetota bacterium]
MTDAAKPAEPTENDDLPSCVHRLVEAAGALAAAAPSDRRDVFARAVVQVAPTGRVMTSWFSVAGSSTTLRRDGPPLVIGRGDEPHARTRDVLRQTATQAVDGSVTISDEHDDLVAATRRGSVVAVVAVSRDIAHAPLLAAGICSLASLVPRTKATRTASAALPASYRKVLDLLLEGHRERDVAERLGMSVHAVHGRVRRIYRRFDVTRRPKLIAKIRRSE